MADDVLERVAHVVDESTPPHLRAEEGIGVARGQARAAGLAWADALDRIVHAEDMTSSVMLLARLRSICGGESDG